MNYKPDPVAPQGNEILIFVKIGPHFILPDNVRSVVRFGKGTKIILSDGDELVVNISYEKVAELVK